MIRPLNDLLLELDALGVKLSLEDGALRFRAPSGALTPALREEMGHHKPALLRLLQQQTGTAGGFTRGERPARIPLSFSQRRLWFLDQAGTGSAYVMSWHRRVVGRLNLDTLERALTAVVDRHEALRTRFPSDAGEPYQQIGPPPERVEIGVLDLRSVAPSTRNAGLDHALAANSLRPFDLERDLMVRLQVVILGDTEAYLLIAIHHIACDGWSIDLIERELFGFYRTFSDGTTPAPGPLEAHYADYALWQRRRLTPQRIASELAHWKRQVRSLPAVHRLPLDHPRSATTSFAGDVVAFRLGPEVVARMRELTRSRRTTPFTGFLAVFLALVSRLSGEHRVATGVPVANRPHPQLEPLIGFFVNTLVVGADLESDPTFLTLLDQVRNTTDAAYAHQDLPFEILVDELQPERDLAVNPLIQLGFAQQSSALAAAELPGALLEAPDFTGLSVRLDLEVHLWPGDDHGLVGHWLFKRDLFDQTTVERFAWRFQTLLDRVLCAPDLPLSRHDLLDPAERALIASWNDTRTPFPRDRTVHGLVFEQARAQPDAVALQFGDAPAISYGELQQRATRLARHLLSLGVGPGDRVGVSLERSATMVETWLAILATGAAYVPLDPTYPRARLEFMVADAQLRLIVGSSEATTSVGSLDTPLLDLDTLDLSVHSCVPLDAVGTATDIAYILYTSGSTGIPKGVCVSHRAIARLVRNTNYLELGPTTRMAQASNASFDAATFEIWGSLANGGTLIGVSRETLLDPPRLRQLLQRERIGVLFITTSLFNQLARVDPTMFGGLSELLFGGEAIDPAMPARVLAAEPPGRLLHVYGPTETTTFATWHEITSVPAGAVTLPIGAPLSNTTTFVLDPHLELVPPGTPGELFIGGDGVAAGYLDREDLTRERFVDHRGYGRLYRTGDLVRQRLNGAIEFVGRIDQQVKLRGFRVELGEIAAQLRQLPGVADSAVILHRGPAEEDGKQLVAYLVPSQQALDRAAEEHIEAWRTLYEATYSASPAQDPGFDLAGWNSSYTDAPIGEEPMRAWVDFIVDDILALSPTRVLEIGCGTGLLLTRIAPHCAVYHGTDYSPPVIRQLEALRNQRPELAHVTLHHLLADDLSPFAPASVDLVILNSIVQYFPDLGYLLRVLAGAVEVLAPGGILYVGDVRNARLLTAYHAGIAALHHPEGFDADELAERVETRSADEEELLIDPAFFENLREYLPEVASVDIHLQRGREHNELTKFRYQAVIRLKGGPVELTRDRGVPQRWDVTWSLARLEHWLGDLTDHAGTVVAIPNARVAADVTLAAWLLDRRRGRSRPTPPAAIDPEDVWALAERHGYRAHLTWSRSGGDACFDATFVHCSLPGNVAGEPHADPDRERPLARYANQPLLRQAARSLIPEVREQLTTRLPEYMVPSIFMAIDHLPLTPNGKVDREQLPLPRVAGSPAARRMPSTDAERQLAQIWSDVLGVAQIGLDDNFFELGGDSIRSIQVVARAKAVGLTITTRDVFAAPTVGGLAAAAEKHAPAPVLGDDDQPIRPTPIQQWFFETQAGHHGATLSHFVQSVQLRVPADSSPLRWERALQQLVHTHEALRLRFLPADSGWRLQPGPPSDTPRLEVADLVDLPRQALAVNRRIDIAAGTLLQAALLHEPDGQPSLLYIAAHHLAIDAVSWRQLLPELAAAYEREEPPSAEGLGFSTWARWLASHGAEAVANERTYWRDAVPAAIPSFPCDGAPGTHDETYGDSETITVALDHERTHRLLTEVPRTTRSSAEELLVTAVWGAIADHFGLPSVLLELEGHGRQHLEGRADQPDLAHTVGWFTSLFPLWLAPPRPGAVLDDSERLAATKTALRAVPQRGIGYGILRYLGDDPVLRRHPRPPVGFTYLGAFGAEELPRSSRDLFLEVAASTSVCEQAPELVRGHLLDIAALVLDGRLEFRITSSTKRHTRPAIAGFGAALITHTSSLVDSRPSPESVVYSLGDFTATTLSNAGLNDLIRRLDAKRSQD